MFNNHPPWHILKQQNLVYKLQLNTMQQLNPFSSSIWACTTDLRTVGHCSIPVNCTITTSAIPTEYCHIRQTICWGSGQLKVTIWQCCLCLPDFQKLLHVHQRLFQLPIEPPQELQGVPKLCQQALDHHLQHGKQCSLEVRNKKMHKIQTTRQASLCKLCKRTRNQMKPGTLVHLHPGNETPHAANTKICSMEHSSWLMSTRDFIHHSRLQIWLTLMNKNDLPQNENSCCKHDTW